MKQQTNIYTVKVEQTIRETYRIQAQTKEEGLRIAAELWSMDKNNDHKDNVWDVATSTIKSENSNPRPDELEYVDNK